jgi:hypothetical protein
MDCAVDKTIFSLEYALVQSGNAVLKSWYSDEVGVLFNVHEVTVHSREDQIHDSDV